MTNSTLKLYPLSRRQVVKGIFVSSIAVSTAAYAGRHDFSNAKKMKDFIFLSTYLTAKPLLSPQYIGQVYAKLSSNVPNFDSNVKQMVHTILRYRFVSVKAFYKYISANNASMKDQATQIIKTYYTGSYNDGKNDQSINFPMALMFIPTLDKSVIPTYSKRRPYYWVANP